MLSEPKQCPPTERMKPAQEGALGRALRVKNTKGAFFCAVLVSLLKDDCGFLKTCFQAQSYGFTSS
jgi:hypothetical protein